MALLLATVGFILALDAPTLDDLPYTETNTDNQNTRLLMEYEPDPLSACQHD